MIRNPDYQDQKIVDQLDNPNKFDELNDDPTERVIGRVETFCAKCLMTSIPILRTFYVILIIPSPV